MSQPKSIGIDARFFTAKATGIGRHVYELVSQLAQIDQVNHYTLYLNLEQFESFVVPNKRFTKALAPYKHYSLAEQWSFWRQLDRGKHDLMVFPHFNAPILYRRPYVVTIHDLTLHLYPGKKQTGRLARLAYKLVISQVVKNAQHVFTVSENTKRDVTRFLGTAKDKITVTYNGGSDGFYCLDKKDYQMDLPEKFFFYIGVFRSHKNIDGLIRAYRLYRNQNPETETKLLLAGPMDETYVPELQQLICDLDLDRCVQWMGFVSDQELNELYNRATAFVFPSFYEGFGVPPLEAMMTDTPVVCSATSSLPEVCGEAALYFDPQQPTEMALCLGQIVGDGELRKHLVAAGREQLKKFSWDKMASEMYEVYEKELSKK